MLIKFALPVALPAAAAAANVARRKGAPTPSPGRKAAAGTRLLERSPMGQKRSTSTRFEPLLNARTGRFYR